MTSVTCNTFFSDILIGFGHVDLYSVADFSQPVSLWSSCGVLLKKYGSLNMPPVLFLIELRDKLRTLFCYSLQTKVVC